MWSFDKGVFYENQTPVAMVEDYDPAGDTVEAWDKGVFRLTRCFGLRQARTGELAVNVLSLGKQRFYEIPCVTYHGNHWGSGVEPQGLTGNGQPWVYAHHRSSVPGCTYSETDENSLCLFGDLANPPFSMSLEETEKGMRHRLLLPQVEKPVSYTAKAAWAGARLPKLHCSGSLNFTAWVVLEKAAGKGLAIQKTLDVAHRLMGHPLRPKHTTEELWELGIRFATESAYFQEDGFKGFCMGLYADAGAWHQRRNVLEIGWVGQNALMAVSLMREGVRRRDEKLIRQGADVLDGWQAARLPNGLFRCRFDAVQAHAVPAADEKEDCANLYSAVVQYLEAWRLARAWGLDKPAWRDTALALCRFALGAQLEDGSFPRAWHADGRPAERDGTAGAYMAWALMAGWKETNDAAMLQGAKRSFACYFSRFERDGYLTAGALDTLCIDKEGAMPLLGLAVELFAATGDEHYLRQAEDITTYLETWLYHYSVHYPAETLLGAFHYDTLGGGAVSTQHQHIDAYALLCVPLWVRLAKWTGKAHYRRIAWEVWCNATQFVSDGSMVIDGMVRPAGSQDEGVCQTWWHTSRGEPMHTSRWLVCWNGAFRLAALADRETLTMLKTMEEGKETYENNGNASV